jgi:3-hydroxyacyl-CoA dehydrogenase
VRRSPVEIADLGELDAFMELLRNLQDDPQIPRLLHKCVKESNQGYKTGQGFYSWSAERLEHTIRSRDRWLKAALAVNGDVDA